MQQGRSPVQSGRRLVRLSAVGHHFSEAWRGQTLAIRGTAAADGDLAVVTPSPAPEGPAPEVVGRCEDGLFFPTYRSGTR